MRAGNLRFLVISWHMGFSQEMRHRLESIGHEVQVIDNNFISQLAKRSAGKGMPLRCSVLSCWLASRLVDMLPLPKAVLRLAHRASLRVFSPWIPEYALGRWLWACCPDYRFRPDEFAGIADELLRSAVFRRAVARCDYLACGYPPKSALLAAELARRCGKPVMCVLYHRFNMWVDTPRGNAAIKQAMLDLQRDPASILATYTEYERRYCAHFLPALRPRRLRATAGYLPSPSPARAPYNDTALTLAGDENGRFAAAVQSALDRLHPGCGLQVHHSRRAPAERAVDFSSTGYPQSLTRYRAVILIPYSAYSGTLFEVYRMNVPILVPSLRLLLSRADPARYARFSSLDWATSRSKPLALENQGLKGDASDGFLVMDRALHPVYCTKAQYRLMEPDDDPEASPNSYHPKALSRWLPLMEVYALPHILQFDSVDELAGRLFSLDSEREGIQQGMREQNAHFEREASALFAEAVDRAAAARSEAA